MQKNSKAVAAGILALALLVGGFALYKNQTGQKAAQTAAPYTDDQSAVGNNTDETTAVNGDKNATTDNGATTSTTSPNTGTTGTTDTTKPNDAKNVPDTHTVTTGETLRDIAKHYYGDPVYSGDIERVNGLSNPNNIPVGKVLKLPRPSELNSASTTPAANTHEAGKAPDTTDGNNATR